jgi:diguanylate cyclase (GGDEF)-like protein
MKIKPKCWEVHQCQNKSCPAFESQDLRCWLFSGTYSHGKVQGQFIEKMEICLACQVFLANVENATIKDTFALIHDQMMEYRQMVDAKNIELEKLATTDKLTGAYNRIKFEEIIEKEIERIRRYRLPFSMIMFDIDRFKEANDTYGHNVGDYVLRTIADMVKGNIRTLDYFVRWGGDEFVIIVPECTCNEAYALAEKIRRIAEDYRFDQVGKVTISSGVVEALESDTEDSLVKRADDALYKAKGEGGNRSEAIKNVSIN